MIKDKRKKIALIYEGVKTEKNLFDSVTQNFFAEKTDVMIVPLPADGNIYMLWNRLREDDFETDIISVLAEMNCALSEQLKEIKADDFSEVYLFFDYDGHNDNIPKDLRRTDVVAEMLKTFNNETELGKLYISYPMIESLKDIVLEAQDYSTLYIDLSECSRYKELVGGESDFGDFRKISKEMWYIACNASKHRASLIVSYSDKYDYTEFIKNVTQEAIYEAQKSVFIKSNHQIGILNAVPLFLIEYYGEEFWNTICKVKEDESNHGFI